MTPATVPAVALTAVLTAVPISSQAALAGAPLVDDPTTMVATETMPVDTAAELEMGEEVPDPAMFDGEGAPDASDEAAPDVPAVPERDREDFVLTTPLDTPPEEGSTSPDAEGETSDTTTPVPLAAVTDGYQEDGYDRPFWWASDGLHFRDPIPASGYVNINVPGANNVSIDTNRELIGTTFIPWSYFGLQPGMCIAWTESNGYSYHFGEDNSGRGGTDERDWTYCVPEMTEPEKPVDPVDPPVDPVDPPVDPVDPPVDPVDPPVDPVDPPADPVGPADPAVPSEQGLAPADSSVASVSTGALDSASVPSGQGEIETAVRAPAPTTSLAWTGATTAGLALAAASVIAGGAGLLAAARRHSSR